MVDQQTLTSVLSEFARTLITDFPTQGILDHLVVRIVDVLAVSGAGVTLISPGTAPRYVAASDPAALGFEGLQTELQQGPCLAACASRAPVSVPDLGHDDRFPLFAREALDQGMAAVFAFPLRHGDECLGALDLYCGVPGQLDDDDMLAAQTLADVVAAYLLNAQLREQAREQSEGFRTSALHDPLTGLPNRALLQERIQHAGERAQRSHARVAVLFADLDRFKHVNDTYGHAAGDQLLVAVARRLTSVLRPGDTLARVSGDEFVILCEDLTDLADAEVLAARVQLAFTEPFRLADADVAMSASVGIAYTGLGETVSDRLVADADLAMYRVKRAGGGAVEVVGRDPGATTAAQDGESCARTTGPA